MLTKTGLQYILHLKQLNTVWPSFLHMFLKHVSNHIHWTLGTSQMEGGGVIRLIKSGLNVHN